MTIARFGQSTPALHQRGVAAIEFALVFLTLFLILYGIVTYGAVLYMQQVVSRAAEDGARAASYTSATLPNDDSKILQNSQDAAYDSLAGSFIVPAADNGSQASRRNWIIDNKVTATPSLSVASGTSPRTVVVVVTYPYNDKTGLLPQLLLLGTSLWMPTQLTGRATATLPS